MKCAIIFLLATTTLTAAPRLWYRQPARNWNEALPVGNGRLGAMVFGGPAEERWQLNENTLWSGFPREWNNPEARVTLPLVRQAAAAGRYEEADQLAKRMQGPYTESYLPMGDLRLSFPQLASTEDYQRELDLDRAVATTSFRSGATRFRRETFASFPARAIVVRLTADRPGQVTFRARLSSQLRFTVQAAAATRLVMRGEAPGHVEPVYRRNFDDAHAIQYGGGMRFETTLEVRAQGGITHAADGALEVTGADAVTLIVTASTTYKAPEPTQVDQNYDQLLAQHLADYQPIFGRWRLRLGRDDDRQPTDERLRAGADPALMALFAQYARYLMIASSRSGGQPGNLKGLWNDRLRPEWSANWALNHDAEMYYYAVETGNTAEMAEPFLDFIDGLAVNGAKTAAVNYGARGWMAHHNSDLWRQTGAAGDWGGGNPHWALFMLAGPWLSLNYWEHYAFSGDRRFLRERAWPVMKGAAEFCLDLLVEDGRGHLVTNPSVSPENIFVQKNGRPAQISVGSTVDMSLIWDLFTNLIEASRVLGLEPEFAQRLREARARLLRPQLGKNGRLQEWAEDWESTDPGHRHLSHLFGFFPGKQWDALAHPALAEGARVSLRERDASAYGWSLAWKAALWARLGNGDEAWRRLRTQLSAQPSDDATKSGWTYPNLFNADPPWVLLNGNMCALAAAIEMLVQSHTDEIRLLPALSAEWPEGEVSGVRARGGFEVSLQWSAGRLTGATLRSTLGQPVRLRTPESVRVTTRGRTVKVRQVARHLIEFPTSPGEEYQFQTGVIR